ncbi:unnamed protein product (macronuclear) [Paramecium tetraurelia]|uniref:Uncharacterized protein n=1 Tax=Paramecium tetraurelia TaxID=5888 RepID=A0DZ25_PARTE|nr:uncharacterized protein GSPATT00003261001 [Paramecium tetraurelia]CAK88292.1 unnamed protein product [Paramecium tetraurelia]|eukprot:XP_001455689.1 hypothetical protein (macronuclear) [Paramecium tetraurelia strain d4-2]
MDLIDTKVIELSSKTGIPDDQLKIFISLILCTLFGFIFKLSIRGRQARLIAGSVFGVLITYYIYRSQIINVLFQTVVVYILVKVLGKKSPWPVFVESMIFVAAHHIYRQYTDYGGWKMDVTTILMMDTPKWTAFAFCVSDGLKTQLSKEQEIRKIVKLPSFFEYFSFIFFFAGSVLGPCFDYYDFDQFINEDKEYKSIPSTIKETLRLLKNAVICMGIFLFTEKYFPLHFVTTEEFGTYNVLYQTLWFNIMVAIQRTKYYGGWQLGEMSMASCGITYQGDGKFEKIKAVDVDWDLTYNMKDKVEKWNISIQTWLRRYVYTRIYSEEEMKKSPSKQNIAYQMTYVVSSLWHGFYIGYYFSFFQWAIMNTVNKAIFRVSCNTNYLKIFETNPLAKIVRWYIANTVFNVFGITFLLLSVDPILKFYSNIRYVPHILLYGTYAFFLITNFGQKSKKQKE